MNRKIKIYKRTIGKIDQLYRTWEGFFLLLLDFLHGFC